MCDKHMIRIVGRVCAHCGLVLIKPYRNRKYCSAECGVAAYREKLLVGVRQADGVISDENYI